MKGQMIKLKKNASEDVYWIEGGSKFLWKTGNFYHWKVGMDW
jgi:hypothetical protein